MVVEFLAAVVIANVAPTLGADGVVAAKPRHDRRALTFRGWILEHRHEAFAVVVHLRGQAG